MHILYKEGDTTMKNNIAIILEQNKTNNIKPYNINQLATITKIDNKLITNLIKNKSESIKFTNMEKIAIALNSSLDIIFTIEK